jgi:arabinose-5-phosphate isomerase
MLADAMKYSEQARQVLDIEIAGLRQVRAALGPEFERAVGLMLRALEAGHKIVVSGVGKNVPVGQKIASTLTSTGSPAVFMHPGEAMHGELGLLQDGDVLLVLSYSGESEEILNLLPAVRRHGAKIVALTASRQSALGRVSDEVISVRVAREACPFNLAPTASTTVTLAIGDALAMVLLGARGFRREDYAKLHPGGAIGRTLLLRIADIMRTGDRLAAVRKGATVRDAIIAMTRAKSGAVAIVDGRRKLAGVFTDGDLRRHLAETPDLIHRSIDEVMTRRPITLHHDQLAVDALNVFQRHLIDDVVVVDRKGRLAGLVDIQDLPKLKIL